MEQKKFMDIQRLKEGYADGFVPGDLIVIQEKFDGSNAAARYDAETGKMVAFSRRHTLDQNNTLNGFYNYVQELNPEDYKDVPDYVIFGEWSGARNAIIYYPENTKKWYVFDIYDVREEKYLPQSEVKLGTCTKFYGSSGIWRNSRRYCYKEPNKIKRSE